MLGTTGAGVAACVALLAVASAPASAQTPDVWSPAASMTTSRIDFTATFMPTTGKILVAGGSKLTAGGGTTEATTQLYDPATDTFSAAASMQSARRYFAGTWLPTIGRVLVTGSSTNLASAELYNPANDTWSPAGTMSATRYRHTVTWLPTVGRVLVVGGGGGTSVDLYDPSSNTWSAAAPTSVPRLGQTATLLPSGDVLVVGGHSVSASQTAEVYHPASDTWTSAGAPGTPRNHHTATLLPDRRVLVAGSIATGSYSASAEIYDPASPPASAWTAIPNMTTPRAGHTAISWNGQVLVTGGHNNGATAERYDPVSGTWTAAASMAGTRVFHTTTLLPSGKVIAIGGQYTLTQTRAEVYGPRAVPGIRTSATPTAALGGSIADVATLQGLDAPIPGDTVTFRLYGPGDPTCSQTPVYDSPNRPVTVSGTSGTASAAPFQVNTAGAYRWRAFYSGDVNNAPVAGPCNDIDETSTVAKATPQIATTASASVTVGGQLSDEATVSGRVNPQPGATIEFRLYGPDDATCSGAPAFQTTTAYPVAGGPVSSAPFQSAFAGTYRWRAFYSGDQNNAPVSGACNDAGESAVVTRATPHVTTTASPSITLGGTISDSATVGGRVNPQPGATVDFRLYGPDDTTCSGTPVFESLNRPYGVADVAVASASYQPVRTGVYRWRAFYGGDRNNAPAAAPCDPDERVLVSAAAQPATTPGAPAGSPSAPAGSPPAPGAPPPRPPIRPGTTRNPLLACTNARLVLIDVLQDAGRVRLRGAADPSLAGKRVKLVFTATRKQVAQATIAADGSFAARAALPPKALRSSNRARYLAVIGNEASNALKLVRRLVVTSATSARRMVTLRGRVVPPLGRPIQRVTISQRVSCSRTKVVKTFKPSSSGRFAVRIAAPAGAKTAVYVLRTAVRSSRHGRKLTLTKSLPRDVAIR